MKKGIQTQKPGFTIVELLVVIVMIGILTAVVIVAYHGWRQSTADNVMQSDLNGAASALEDAKNWGSGYPATIPSTFHASDHVTLTGGGSEDGSTFCVAATSTEDPGKTYHISNTMTKPDEGGCPPSVSTAPTIAWSGLRQRTGSWSPYATPSIDLPTGVLQAGDVIVLFMSTEDNPDVVDGPSSIDATEVASNVSDQYWHNSAWVSSPLSSAAVADVNGGDTTISGTRGTDAWSMAVAVIRGSDGTVDPTAASDSAQALGSAPSTILVGPMAPSGPSRLALIWLDEQNWNNPTGNASITGWTAQQAAYGQTGDTGHAVGLFSSTISATTSTITITAAPWSGNWYAGNGGYAWISLGFAPSS